MGMFDNYDYPVQRIPNNRAPERLNEYIKDTDEEKVPEKVYDIKGNFIGYSFNYGDNFTFNIESIPSVINVYEDSIVYNSRGQRPNINTKGIPGQKAYNTVDFLSWTCSGCENNKFIWIQDLSLTYPVDGTKTIDINLDENVVSMELDVFNFRWEQFHKFGSDASGSIKCSIIGDVAKKFLPGTYYCTVKVNTNTVSYVKDKFLLIVKGGAGNVESRT